MCRAFTFTLSRTCVVLLRDSNGGVGKEAGFFFFFSHCFKVFICIYSYILHNNPLRYYSYAHFIEAKLTHREVKEFNQNHTFFFF